MHAPALRLAGLALVCAFVLGAGATPAHSEDEPPKTPEASAAPTDPTIFPLKAVRPGMRGYGYTVKHGTQRERFEVEVIDVFENWLVKQDIILVRCLGEAFADHQIAQGMSGSPIYFGDRLAGALSYTFAWAKHPVGGVTPIETMLAESERPLEGNATGALPPTPLKPAEEAAPTQLRGMRPIGTPLAVSGFSWAGRKRLREELASSGMHVVDAPATAVRRPHIDAPLEPGAALTVDLLRGDFNASAMGTITAVRGDRVLAFGHNMQGLGETSLPVSVGYVHTVVATRNMSFKLGGSLREFGTLIQDRPSCIVCDSSRKAPMVPVKATFRNAVTGRAESFNFEVTPNTIFFQPLMMSALQECFAKAEAALGPNTKRLKMTVKLKGLDPWTWEDAVAGFDGGFSRVLINLIDRPLNHRSQRPEFESFSLDVAVEHVDRRAFIRRVTSDVDEARRGDAVTLQVHLDPMEYGPTVTEALQVFIPRDAPPGDYGIRVVGGDLVPANVASPWDIEDFPAMYKAFRKSTELVALLPRRQVDVDADGHLLRRLPLSSLPRIARVPNLRGVFVRQVHEEVAREVPYVVAGSGRVAIRIVE